MANLEKFKDNSGKIIEYDPDMYEIMFWDYNEKSYLHFRDDFEGQIIIPEGLTYAECLFKDCKLDPIKHDFSKFDTSGITDMSRMFYILSFLKVFH